MPFASRTGVIEYLLQEAGLDRLEGVLEISFSGGRLRKARVHLGPLRPSELEQLYVSS